MTVKYGFYDSLNGDRLYNANDINTFFEGVFSDGVFEFVGDGLKVENSPGTMNVLVKDGRAWFNNLWIRNTSTLTLTLEPSHMIYDRIDVVILEFDSSMSVRENSIKIITGTPSTTPVPPVLTHTSTLNQYALAHIYVGASVSEILMADITNKIGTISTPYAKSLVYGPTTLGVNDFQVGNGSGSWIKKTLNETVTILRSILDTVFAPISNGVTNGDSHNHVGGNGAPLVYTYIISSFLTNTSVPPSTTYYARPGGSGVDSIAYQIPWPEGGVVSKLTVRISGAQPVSGTLVITLTVNGVVTALTVTIPAGAAGGTTHVDSVNTLTINPSDTIKWNVTNNATSISATMVSINMILSRNTS